MSNTEQHSGGHDPQSLPLFLTSDVHSQWHHAGGSTFVAVRIGSAEIDQHVVHVGLRLLDSQPGLQTSDDL